MFVPYINRSHPAYTQNKTNTSHHAGIPRETATLSPDTMKRTQCGSTDNRLHTTVGLFSWIKRHFTQRKLKTSNLTKSNSCIKLRALYPQSSTCSVTQFPVALRKYSKFRI